MAARMSLEDQIKFLLSCVKWSVNGKIDFDQVASECEVVTKGAAAKRYERMVKQYGTQGGLPDNPVPSNKKSMHPPKLPKRRKPEDVTGMIKYNEEEERTLPTLKRPRNASHLEMKQQEPLLPTPSPVNYPPYMFSPGVTPQGHYMARHLPLSMIPGMPYGTQSPHMQQSPYRPSPPHLLHAPHPMFPGMHNNHQFIPPMHQSLASFQYHQDMLRSGQEPVNPGILDEIHNFDFGGGGYEAMLNGDKITNEPLLIDDWASAKVPYQTVGDLPIKSHHQIKVEPCQASSSPFPDSSTENTTTAPQQEPVSRTLTPIVQATTVAATIEPSLNEVQGLGIPSEAEKHSAAMAAIPVLKEEDVSCIFISD